MTTFIAATNSVDSSAHICDYLDGRVTADDTVYAINSQVGGDETSSEAIRDGEEALNVIQSRLGAATTVETHQLVRGNKAHVDVREFADEVDADEIVIAIRQRSRTEEILFGSVARKILSRSSRPVVSVPRASGRSDDA